MVRTHYTFRHGDSCNRAVRTMGELLKGFQLSDVCTDLAAAKTYLLHWIATPAASIQDEFDGPNSLHMTSQ